MDAKKDAKMDEMLEKIELVKDKTGVTYKEAKDALESANENVVDAIIKIEEEVNALRPKGICETWKDEITDKIKELANKGSVTRIKVRKGRQILINLPITAGILGIAMAPTASIVGLIAAFGYKCTIEIQKEDGSIINLSRKAENYYDYALEKAPELYELVRTKGIEAYNAIKNSDAYKNFSEKKNEAIDVIGTEVNDKLDELKAKGIEVYEVIKEKDAEISRNNATIKRKATIKATRDAKNLKEKKEEFIDSLKK